MHTAWQFPIAYRQAWSEDVHVVLCKLEPRRASLAREVKEKSAIKLLSFDPML